jgi:hypothetical protein
MKLRFACTPLLALAASLPIIASAQIGLNELAHNVKALDKNFDAADANHDGMLNPQEAQAVPFIATNYDAIDVKNRGSVSKQDVHDYIARALKSTSNKTAPTAPSSSHP